MYYEKDARIEIRILAPMLPNAETEESKYFASAVLVVS
jgi:hypothetical protein